MNSIGEECTPLKWDYDKCFNSWFRESYLPGRNISHDQACGELFQSYQNCVKKALKREGIDFSELQKSMVNNTGETPATES